MTRRSGWTCGGVFDLVGRHKNYDRRLHEVVLKQDPRLVVNCATAESRRLYEMQRSVMRCLHLKKSFLRLNVSEHGILYARVELEHDIGDLLLRHFHQRFPTFHIAIEHDRRVDVIDTTGRITHHKMSLQETLNLLESTLPPNPALSGLHYTEDLWSEYFESQNIRERRNPQLQRRMMPQKYRDPDAIETLKAKKCRSITEYLPD